MKQIKFIIAIITLTFMFSCEDAIDIEQKGTFYLDQQYDGTVKSLKDGMLGLYSNLDNTNEIKFNAVFTDEISIGVENGGQQRAQYGINLTSATSTAYSIWANSYISISQINRFIKAAENTTPIASELTDYNNLVGEAYAMRAYLHFVLETYYTTDLTDDNALGVVILDKVAGVDEFFKREKNVDVFNFIESDLTKADAMILDNGVFRFGKNTIKAIRARMAAYRGDYTTAETLATELLTAFPLADNASYQAVWHDTNDTGIIFKFKRVQGDAYDRQSTGMTAGGNAGTMFSFGASGGNQSAYLEMSRSLFNKLNTSDVRYNVLLDGSTSTIDPNYLTSPDVINSDILKIGKYYSGLRSDQLKYLLTDLKIFRSAEMLLIIAEAKASVSDYNGVANTLKQLTDMRFGSSTPLLTITTDEEAYAAILAERRLELAYEGFRWVDLRRLGVKANVEIDRDPRDCEINGVCTLDKNSHKFTMPISITSMDVNSELVQNPNY